MNGVHDLGGMDGFTLPERDQGRILKEEWERLFWGSVFALRGVPGASGGGRSSLERMPPELYLSLPYYARLLHVRERALITSGLVTEAELANPDGPMTIPRLPAEFRPATAAEVVASLRRDSSAQIDVDAPAQFPIGAAVVVRNEHPAGHTRVPRYVRGHRGTIVARHGVHGFQDELPAGTDLGPQQLYTVAFDAQELWGSRGHPNDVVHVELWDHHLARA